MYLFTFARCIFRFGFVASVVVVLVVVEVVEVDVDVVVVVAVFAAFNLNLISRFSDISDIERFWANEKAKSAAKSFIILLFFSLCATLEVTDSSTIA